MNAEERVVVYRLFDVYHGHLEELLRVEDELVKLRYSQLKIQQKGFWQKLILCVAIAATAIPAVYSIFPESWKSFLWLVAAITLSAVYISYTAVQLVAQYKDTKQIKKLLPEEAEAPLETRYYFLLSQISSHGTRLWAICNALSHKLPEHMRDNYISLKNYWENELDELESEISKLYDKDGLSITEFETLKRWTNDAREPQVFRDDENKPKSNTS